MRRSLASLALILLALAWSTSVLAGKKSPRQTGGAEAAREHTKKGYTLYQAGKYVEASVEFEEAYSARPDPGLLYNAAQSARLGGDLRKAQTLYSSYVSFHPDGSNLSDAKGHLEKIEAAIKAEEDARKAAAASVTSKPTTTTPAADDPSTTEPPPRSSDEKRSDRPVYKKWWFWTAIVGGAAVVATGVTLGVVLTRPAPDWNNTGDIGPGAPAPTNAVLQVRF